LKKRFPLEEERNALFGEYLSHHNEDEERYAKQCFSGRGKKKK